jgi:Na+/proline symporter
MIFLSIALLIGLLIIFLAFITSYLKDNIVVIVFQIVGSFAPPILGVYLLGFFVPRVNSRVRKIT